MVNISIILMPVTPFHFGPGLLFRALLKRRFSFRVFVWSQIIIDMEVLYNFLFTQGNLHTFFHTYLGGIVVALLTSVSSILFLWIRNSLNTKPKSVAGSLSISTLIISSTLGAWSHVFLDSIMHSDIEPLAPWTNTNSLLGVIGLSELHGLCLVSGVLGFLIIAARLVIKR